MGAPHPINHQNPHLIDLCWRSARLGLLVSAALIIATSLVESTEFGRGLQMAAYSGLIRFLPERYPKALPVVVDIGGLPGGTEQSPTPRTNLRQIIDALRQRGARAIAVDVDFSPDARGWKTPDDVAFFQYCLDLTHAGTPIFLGVARQRSAPVWLGLKKFDVMAAGGLARSGDTRIPAWVDTGDPQHSLPTFARALADTYRDKPQQLPTWTRWILQPEPSESDAHKEDAELLINYSKLDAQIAAWYRATSARDIAIYDNRNPFASALILIGKSENATDQFNVPMRDDPVAGVRVMAAATYTLAMEPLHEFNLVSRVALDLLISIALLGCLVRICKLYSEGDPRGEEARALVLWLFVGIVLILGCTFLRVFHILWIDFLLVILALLLHPRVERLLHRLKKLLKLGSGVAALTLFGLVKSAHAQPPTHDPQVCKPNVSAYVIRFDTSCRLNARYMTFDAPLLAGDVIDCKSEATFDIEFCRTNTSIHVPAPGQKSGVPVHYVVPDVYPPAAPPVSPLKNTITIAGNPPTLNGGHGLAGGEDSALTSVGDWTAASGDSANQRYSALRQIDTHSVNRLQVAWTLSTGLLRGPQATPLAVGDTMYINAPQPGDVIAINLQDQSFRWRFLQGMPSPNADVLGQQGLAYGKGKILLQAFGKLVALDAKSGKPVWSQTLPQQIGERVQVPRVFGDKALVGIIGRTRQSTRLLVYDLGTGVRAWTDNTISGVVVDPYSYDSALNLLYYTAEGVGDSKTIFARDLDTGRVKWTFPIRSPMRTTSDSFTSTLLADVDTNGTPTRSLVHFDTNGEGYTLNRETGRLISTNGYARQAAPASNLCNGGKLAQVSDQSSFDPQSGWVFASTRGYCARREPFTVVYTTGPSAVGETLTLSRLDPSNDTGISQLFAWDPVNSGIRWSRSERLSIASTPLVTAGHLIFYGTLDGYLKAASTEDGREWWKFKLPSGIVGNVFTYQFHDRQFLGVYSGTDVLGGLGASSTSPGTESFERPLSYKDLARYLTLGGSLFIFSLPTLN